MSETLWNKEIIASFKTYSLSPSGKRDYGSLTDVDKGFANSLLAAFDGVTVTVSRRETKALEEFLTRTDGDKITAGNFDTVADFLASYEAAHAGRLDTKITNPVNKLALPVVNVGRTADFSFYQGDITKADPVYGTLGDENETAFAIVSMQPIQLNYKVWVVANERETLSQMGLIIGDWFGADANRGKTSFCAASSLAGRPVDIECRIMSAKDVTFTDVSLPSTQDRVYALELAVTVIADSLVAHLSDLEIGRLKMTGGSTYGNE